MKPTVSMIVRGSNYYHNKVASAIQKDGLDRLAVVSGIATNGRSNG